MIGRDGGSSANVPVAQRVCYGAHVRAIRGRGSLKALLQWGSTTALWPSNATSPWAPRRAGFPGVVDHPTLPLQPAGASSRRARRQSFPATISSAWRAIGFFAPPTMPPSVHSEGAMAAPWRCRGQPLHALECRGPRRRNCCVGAAWPIHPSARSRRPPVPPRARVRPAAAGRHGRATGAGASRAPPPAWPAGAPARRPCRAPFERAASDAPTPATPWQWPPTRGLRTPPRGGRPWLVPRRPSPTLPPRGPPGPGRRAATVTPARGPRRPAASAATAAVVGMVPWGGPTGPRWRRTGG